LFTLRAILVLALKTLNAALSVFCFSFDAALKVPVLSKYNKSHRRAVATLDFLLFE
jgi:hypothetical protein